MASEKKARNFLGVLYPDAENYVCEEVLARLDDVFSEWAYILHDSDVDDEGNPKKPHIHWVGKLENATSIQAISDGKHLGVPERDIEFCRNWKSSVRYLVHKDDSEKFQYVLDGIVTNIASEALELLMAGRASEAYKVRMIRDYIYETHCTSVEQLMDWTLENGCWSEFRRSFSIWSCVLREEKEKTI